MDPQMKLMTPPLLLCWTDSESGEDLCILVHGPPEFLEELRVEGFRPGRAFDREGHELPALDVVVGSLP